MIFTTPAFAQSAGAATAASGNGLLIDVVAPLLAMIAIFYFLVIRPQQKRTRQHQEMISAVKRGDVVVTASGFVGKVARVIDDNEILLELSEGVKVKLVRSAIGEVRSRGKTGDGDGAEEKA